MIAFPPTTSPAQRRTAERYLPLVEQAAKAVARRCGCEAGELVAAGWVALTKLVARDDLDRLENVESWIVQQLKWAMLNQRGGADQMVKRTMRAKGVRMLSTDHVVGDEDGPSMGSMLAGDEDGAADRAAAVDELLAELPPVQRRIVRLIDIDGATVAEAAEATGMTEHRVAELRVAALGRLKRTAKMSQIKTLFGDPRFAAIVKAVLEREQDEQRAAAMVRREVEAAGLADDFMDAAAVLAVRQVRGNPANAPKTAPTEGSSLPTAASLAAQQAAMKSVGRSIIKSFLSDWKLPDGTPLGNATLRQVRKAAAREKEAAVLKLEDAEFLRAVGELADDESAKVSAVTTDRKLEDIFNSARRLVAYQTTDRTPKKTARAGR